MRILPEVYQTLIEKLAASQAAVDEARAALSRVAASSDHHLVDNGVRGYTLAAQRCRKAQQEMQRITTAEGSDLADYIRVLREAQSRGLLSHPLEDYLVEDYLAPPPAAGHQSQGEKSSAEKSNAEKSSDRGSLE